MLKPSVRLFAFVCAFPVLMAVSAQAGSVGNQIHSQPFLVQSDTSRVSAVFANLLVNSPSAGISTRITVVNTLPPTGMQAGIVPEPNAESSGRLDFYLYSATGDYYFFETRAPKYPVSVGFGLDGSGALLPGHTYQVLLSQLLAAVQAPQEFTGYAWIVAHFPHITGSRTIYYFNQDVASATALLPDVGTALAKSGTLGGFPLEEQTLTVGLLSELTGPIPTVGLSCLNGATLAVEQINQAGGVEVGGVKRKLKLDVHDTAGDPDHAAALARDVATRTNAIAIVGPNSSGNAIPAGDVAEARKIVLITPWSTNPRTTLDPATLLSKYYVFRACFTDTFQGRLLATFAYETLNAGKAAVLYDRDTEVLATQAELFKSRFEELGGQVTAFESYGTGEQDVSAQFGRIKDASPDVIFLPSYYTDVPSQVHQARLLGITVPFLGSDAWANEELIAECGADCEGSFLSNHYSPESKNPLTEEFVSAYLARFGSVPDDVAALAYDSVGLLAVGLGKAGRTDRESLADALNHVTKYVGATGEMDFEPGSHDPDKAAVILQIRDGQFSWFADVAP